MFDSNIVDAAVKRILNIVDNIRCAVCDKVNGIRVRYVCGHTSCEECATVAVDCSLCLTPQDIVLHRDLVVDKPLTRRVENAVNLMNAFQDEFHIDVYKRQRLSEQLKIEKELFPECIQAPVKYVNKRKSLENLKRKKSKTNKENQLSQLPGEEVSTYRYKMDQSNVEQWLHKYVRKPLGDINKNDDEVRRYSNIKKNNYIGKDAANTTLHKLALKRPHNKSALSDIENQSNYNRQQAPIKKSKRHNAKDNVKSNLSKPYLKKDRNDSFDDKNESGIVLDEEEETVIKIEDSESVKIDKDQAALQAVHDAENNKPYDSVSIDPEMLRETLVDTDIDPVKEKEPEITTRVPFYLKGYLSEGCKDCTVMNESSKLELREQNKDVSIIIANSMFTTTVTVMPIGYKSYEEPSTKSAEVQTESTIDIQQNINNLQDGQKNDVILSKCVDETTACAAKSYNCLNDKQDKQHRINTVNVNKTQKVIIEESDSDEDLNQSISMSVTAEIHRSCEEKDYRILSAVDNLGEHSKKPRRAARGHTPASTDSSEKENFNPNRVKRNKQLKKKYLKK